MLAAHANTIYKLILKINSQCSDNMKSHHNLLKVKLVFQFLYFCCFFHLLLTVYQLLELMHDDLLMMIDNNMRNFSSELFFGDVEGQIEAQ